MHLRLELVTYRLYDGGLIALEQIQVEHAPQPALKRQRDRGVLQSEGAQPEELSQKALEQQVRAPDDIRADAEVNSPEAGPAGIERLLERGSLAVRELFAELQAQIVGLGPGVVEHSTGAYIGYRVAQNFAEVHIQRSQIKLNLRPVDYDDPHGMVVKVPETHRWTLDRVVVLGVVKI